MANQDIWTLIDDARRDGHAEQTYDRDHLDLGPRSDIFLIREPNGVRILKRNTFFGDAGVEHADRVYLIPPDATPYAPGLHSILARDIERYRVRD